MSKDIVVEKGKRLAFLLRHDKEAREKGLIDEHGWRQVSELVKYHGYTRQLLDEIVETNNKQRYEYDMYKQRIRARQGHSIQVEVDLKEVTDCNELWHGTSNKYISSILKSGLQKQNRLYVHLSGDMETAEKVGERHGGKLCLIRIDAKQMIEDGKKIWISNNGVYLADEVDPKYFIEVLYER